MPLAISGQERPRLLVGASPAETLGHLAIDKELECLVALLLADDGVDEHGGEPYRRGQSVWLDAARCSHGAYALLAPCPANSPTRISRVAMAVTKITRPIRSTHQLNSEFISLDATPEFHGFAAAGLPR
jgi:hypothetical protein